MLSRLVVILCAFMATGFACDKKPTPEKGQVGVKVAFDSEEFAGKVRLYELAPDSRLKPWTTGAVKSAAALPIGDELAHGILYMRPGAVRRFVLTVHNPTKDPWYFVASPHAIEPAKLSLGFEFRCLCLNHAFTVPPRQTWYRVVELKLDKAFRPGVVEVRHTLVGIDKKRAKSLHTPGATIDPPGAGAGGHAH